MEANVETIPNLILYGSRYLDHAIFT